MSLRQKKKAVHSAEPLFFVCFLCLFCCCSHAGLLPYSCCCHYINISSPPFALRISTQMVLRFWCCCCVFDLVLFHMWLIVLLLLLLLCTIKFVFHCCWLHLHFYYSNTVTYSWYFCYCSLWWCHLYTLRVSAASLSSHPHGRIIFSCSNLFFFWLAGLLAGRHSRRVATKTSEIWFFLNQQFRLF